MFQKRKNNSVHVLIMEQISDVKSCLIKFEEFIRTICVPETAPETVKSLSESVCQAENAADKSLRRMIDSLVGTAYLPSTREDLISVATSCDKIANKCETFTKQVVFQKFHIPEAFGEDFLEIVTVTRAQFALLEKSISLLFSDFGKLLKDHSILDEVRAHESKVDAVEQSLNERIFALDVDLADRLQIASFLELICDISDQIENIADKIQIMLVTRKA